MFFYWRRIFTMKFLWNFTENEVEIPKSKKHASKTAKKKEKPQLKGKKFDAQINCVCKNGCAQKIDVFKQQEIFIKLNDLKKWSQRTLFLRSLVATKPLKVNLNPIIDIKKKEKMYNYHLFNDEGLLTQVCQSFFTKVLQIGREKVYRAISSAQANPNAYERRGKSMKKKMLISTNRTWKHLLEVLLHTTTTVLQ